MIVYCLRARARRAEWRHALATALLGACLSAHAGDVSIGLGAGVDRGKVDCVAPYACDHRSAHGKLFVNYEAAPNFELQAIAFDASRFDGGDTSPLGTPFGGRFKVDGLALAAAYRWDFAPDWSLKGSVGIASVRTRFDYAAPFDGHASRTTTEPWLGASLAYRIAPQWRLSLDVDNTRFKVYTSRGSLRTIGLAAQYTF